MKLNYIVEGNFLQLITVAVEKKLETTDHKGEVTLRIVPASFGNYHPEAGMGNYYDRSAVGLDFFYTPDDESEEDSSYRRFEVRLGDGSSRQYFSIALEMDGEAYPNGVNVEKFFVCENPHTEAAAFAEQIASTMAAFFFGAQASDMIKNLQISLTPK